MFISLSKNFLIHSAWLGVFVVLCAPVLVVAQVPSTSSDLVQKEWFLVENIDETNDLPNGDFLVSPGKVEMELAPGESKTVYISVSNLTGATKRFNLTTEDVKGSSDSSKTVDLLGVTKGPYSLRDYIKYEGSSLVLDNNQRARVPVTITIPSDASPGGLYGSVLISTVSIEGSGQTSSTVVARIGTVFFITVTGEINNKGKLLDFTTIPSSLSLTSRPITFGLVFENTGTVHLSPYGRITINNFLGKEVGYIELEPWFALPQSQRFREVLWSPDYLLGRYTATVEVNRGYENNIDNLSVTFWVLPWKLMLSASVVLLIIIFFTSLRLVRRQ